MLRKLVFRMCDQTRQVFLYAIYFNITVGRCHIEDVTAVAQNERIAAI